MKNILFITGIRPNIVKAFALYRKLLEKNFDVTFMHSNQHYDIDMFAVLWTQFKLPAPFIDSANYPDSQVERLGEMIKRIAVFIQGRKRPDLICVFGDGDTTLAGAIVANKLKIKLAHIEAGLRSFDKTMPEEHNRKLTDHLSDMLFVSEESGCVNLQREGITGYYMVGNTMIDALIATEGLIIDRSESEYILLTLHRPSNVDFPGRLKAIFDRISRLNTMVIFPAHPRTKRVIDLNSIKVPDNVILMGPLGYFEFLGYERRAKAIITDSGGVQEEATYFNVPCYTLRKNTERPATIIDGTNILSADGEIDLSSPKKRTKMPYLWDGHASDRIVEVLENE